MHEPPLTGPVTGDTAGRLAEFARACKAAARAVSLYPPGHPAVAASLGRLARITAALTQPGACRLQVAADRLVLEPAAPPALPSPATGSAAAPRPDPALSELASLLHRHHIGRLTLHAGADADSWRALLLLLARPVEEVRGDGGIRHLWASAGGPGIEIEEIDYAEVLREKQGVAAAVEEIVAAAIEGRQLELDDAGMRLLLDIVQDPGRLDALLTQVEEAAARHGADAHAAAFLELVRGLRDWLGRTDPARVESVLGQMGRAAGRLTPEAMLRVLEERRRETAGDGAAGMAGAVLERMDDGAVSQFVAASVVRERGASERLALAFQALVPDVERQRRVLDLAQHEVGGAEGPHESFDELWQRVEGMLLSYSDEHFVSEQYAGELSSARTRAVDVEGTSDDPPERIAAWLATVADGVLRSLDRQLLIDLLRIETDVRRWRDIAETAAGQAEALAGRGSFDDAWDLANGILAEGAREPGRSRYASAALERLGRGPMMRQVAAHLRGADAAAYARVAELCHAIGPALVPALAEALSAEQDARARRRLRDILVGFGARGRDSVRQLMSATSWEVRRTAAFLLREFGGAEGLRELLPLLTDSEPLVQREALQALVRDGSEEAGRIVLQALTASAGRTRDTLAGALAGTRDERAAPLLGHLVRHLDRRRHPELYLSAIEALGASGTPEAVEALRTALHATSWRAPFLTRRVREAAARSLGRIGTPEALDVLRAAATARRRGVRTAARAELDTRGD